MTLRIVFPHLAAFPSTDASAIQVANMAQAFAELGHHVTLVSPAPVRLEGSGPLARREEGPPVTSVEDLLGTRPLFASLTLSTRTHRGQSYLHAVRIARMARREDADLVFSRNLRACLIPALRGLATVFEAHTLTALQGAQDRRVLRRLLTARGFRGVVAISGALADDLIRELDIPASRILVAHDAVRLDRIALEPITTPPTTDPARFQVGYTGSLFPGKGVEWVLAAAPRCPWATFHVAGGPSSRAAELAARCAADSDLTNVVIHGELRPLDAIGLQRRMDVLLAPFARRVESDSGIDISRWTSPMKVFEYMASGRPMIVSDLPVLREVLRPGIDALMVEPESTSALVAALVRLRDDAALRTRLATSAAERARVEFTWTARARAILERFGPGDRVQ